MTGWRRPAGPRPRRPEGGSAVLEFLVVAAGFLIPLLFVLLTMDVVQRAMLGTSSAAREAGRVYLAVPGGRARDRVDRAELAASEVLANYGLHDPARVRLEVHVACENGGACPPRVTPGGFPPEFRPGAEVEVTVTYRVPVAGRLQSVLPAELPVRSVHRTSGP